MAARLGRALHLPPGPRSRYGWFWECPNGGDKCQYRHALPAGYVLKSEVKEVEDQTELLEDRIERQRRALTTRTPVTLDRLQLWLKNKQERKAEPNPNPNPNLTRTLTLSRSGRRSLTRTRTRT